jgi:hypothetical protein
MAHYAFLDSNNIVIDIIVGVDENEMIEGLSPEDWYSQLRGYRCVRTSYNGSIRKNYAGLHYQYDEELDAFIAPKPFGSWILDQNAQWVPPVPKPENELSYIWNEDLTDWEAVAIEDKEENA